MFRRKYTKWIPFGNYTYGTKDYIVFVRKSHKTGLLQFKTRSVHGWWRSYTNNICPVLIDVKEAWNTILSMPPDSDYTHKSTSSECTYVFDN